MKPSLPHDVCRCLGLDCDAAETCLHYLCRHDVGPGTPFIQGGAFVDGKCHYRMPANEAQEQSKIPAK